MDDEPNMLFLSKTFLEKTGEYVVDMASSAQEAFTLLQHNGYDIIVSDYIMPGISGLDLLRTLRKQGNQIPFILVSCRGQEMEIVEAINEGLSGYLTKEGDPAYNFAMLSHRINQVVSLKRSEEGWKASEERFRFLYTHMAEGVALFTLVRDRNGNPVDYRFEEVNPRYEEIFQYTAETVRGRCISELIGSVPSLKECSQVVDTKNPVFFEKYLAKPKKYFTISVSPWLSDGFAMIFTDITRRVTAEEQLKETSAYLQNLLKHAGTPIIVWDKGGHINQINQAFQDLTGYSQDELIGKTIRCILPEHDIERLFTIIHLTSLGMHLEAAEIPIRIKTGDIRILKWNSANITGNQGLLRVTIAVGVDITRQKELEEENTTAVFQLKKNLAELAILNDGIRNPLAVILACAEFQDKTSYSRITHQVWEIDRMIDQLDSRWIESEKILKFLEKHYRIGYSGPKEENPGP
ncbi:PAS domain S-box protein [Methanospirillum sp.]|uniref:response regulator n=2 Tax=Methanospirillum sp. TaxID=45200 RepID=UPI002BD54A8A|nr:PAS domain S-box protein [Methanospirillum sp.]HPP77896.1 PAS domain S-box protein [Methanospirillum sp.]